MRAGQAAIQYSHFPLEIHTYCSPAAFGLTLEEGLVAPACSRAVECALNADHVCHTWFLSLDSEIMERVETL